MDKCWLGMWHAPMSCCELGSSSVCQSWWVSFHSHLCRTFLIHSRYIIGLQTLTPNGQIFMCLCWDIRILDDIRWHSMFVHPCTSLKHVKTSDFSIFKCPRQQPCNFLFDESAPLCWVWHPDTIELFQLIFMIGHMNHYVDLKTGPTVKLWCLFSTCANFLEI